MDARRKSDPSYWATAFSASFAASHSAAGLRAGAAVLGRGSTGLISAGVGGCVGKSCARVLRRKRLGLWMRSARPSARPVGAMPTVLRAQSYRASVSGSKPTRLMGYWVHLRRFRELRLNSGSGAYRGNVIHSHSEDADKSAKHPDTQLQVKRLCEEHSR